jgi:hypothetical protein
MSQKKTGTKWMGHIPLLGKICHWGTMFVLEEEELEKVL